MGGFPRKKTCVDIWLPIKNGDFPDFPWLC